LALVSFWLVGWLVLSFLPARRSKCGICYVDVAGWLAGCLSVTRRYCIKTVRL